jgi:LysM repeat protein
VQVTARGFTPEAEVIVGVGRANSEPTSSRTERTDEAGALQTTVTIPAGAAQAGEPWVVLVRNVQAGERALSPTFSVTDAPQETCGSTYVVQPGDWLSRIARRCGTSVEALLAANPQIGDPNLVLPGQVLEIPSSEDSVVRLTVTPHRVAPGGELRVNATGFAPDSEVVVGIGRANSEPTTIREMRSDAQGALEATLVLPPQARPGEPWVVLASSEEQTVLSETITVTATGVTATTRVNLRLRSGPGVRTEILDVAPAGTTVPVRGRTADGDWIRVTFEGRSGWMAAWYTDVGGDLEDVAVEDPFTRTDVTLIALEDGGGMGQLIGCDDSAVPVTVDIEPTEAPLTAALNRLLSIDEAFYGQSGLYNALHGSHLSLQDVSIVNGQATIALAGELILDGTCDAPRVQAQLQQTALQYTTVDEVSITVNGQPLEAVLSER